MPDGREYSVEELFEQLETILEKIEEKDISLEESFFFYEEGMKTLKQCNDKIDQMEKKMLVINAGQTDGEGLA